VPDEQRGPTRHRCQCEHDGGLTFALSCQVVDAVKAGRGYLRLAVLSDGAGCAVDEA
jgi:hypothetical protein